MERYKVITLIDITRSGASRSETDKIKIGQQANFNSLVQTIGIRSNVEWTKDPEKHSGRMPDDIDGRATYWVWEFNVEREDVFREGESKVQLLLNDLHGVPVIGLLENSVDLSPCAFQTSGENQNVWIKII